MTRQAPTVGNLVYCKHNQTRTVVTSRLFVLYLTCMRPQVQATIPQYCRKPKQISKISWPRLSTELNAIQESTTSWKIWIPCWVLYFSSDPMIFFFQMSFNKPIYLPGNLNIVKRRGVEGWSHTGFGLWYPEQQIVNAVRIQNCGSRFHTVAL